MTSISRGQQVQVGPKLEQTLNGLWLFHIYILAPFPNTCNHSLKSCPAPKQQIVFGRAGPTELNSLPIHDLVWYPSPQVSDV